MFKNVETFNQNVIGIMRKPGPMPEDELGFFLGTIQEECDELVESYNNNDFIGQIDSVIDLIYFACGGLTRMGIPSHVSREIFDAVHSANMTKTRGSKEREVMHSNDAVKPEGWVSPEEKIAEILSKHFGT